MHSSPTLKVLAEIKDAPKRSSRGQHHTRAARRTAEASARFVATGQCSRALQPFLAAREALTKAEHANASAADLIEARADVRAVERAFSDRCVCKVSR
jgi:hypothetical protein